MIIESVIESVKSGIVCYVDGSITFNPGGKMKIGYSIFKNNTKIYESGEKIEWEGQTSVNLAEYLALVRVMKKLIELELNKENMIIYSDSKTVTLVINNIHKKPKKLEKILRKKSKFIYFPALVKCLELLPKFQNLKIEWKPIDFNLADALCQQRRKG